MVISGVAVAEALLDHVVDEEGDAGRERVLEQVERDALEHALHALRHEDVPQRYVHVLPADEGGVAKGLLSATYSVQGVNKELTSEARNVAAQEPAHCLVIVKHGRLK